MNISFGDLIASACTFCNKVSKDCKKIKLLENNELPPLYRTLYNYKCAICPTCAKHGNSYIVEKLKSCMDEYIGGEK